MHRWPDWAIRALLLAGLIAVIWIASLFERPRK
jgi:hypothetical protein